MKKCKKCLLLESGERVTYGDIMRYVNTLDKDELVSDDVYQFRINKCKSCDCLISGMCLKCGCYVEVRARLRDKSCPNVNNKFW